MKKYLKNKSQLLTTLICTTALMGCASSYRRPESVEDKMKRYRPITHSSNTTPVLPLIEAQKHLSWMNKEKTGRAPASVDSQEKADEFAAQQSHKRLYFLTLFSQYELLQKYVPEYQASQIRVCPHFHSSLVSHQESYGATPQMSFEKKDYSTDLIQMIKEDETYLSLHPELALPMQSDDPRPRVIDLVTQKTGTNPEVKKYLDLAVSTHLTKTYSELSELCEFGSSDNYYIYENLMSSVEREGGLEKNVQGLQVLLKTSTMFNHALISAINPKIESSGASRAPASTKEKFKPFSPADKYATELLTRMKAQWASPYYNGLQAQKKAPLR